MYWGQLPKLWAIATVSPPLSIATSIATSRPLARLRRRVVKSRPRRPISVPATKVGAAGSSDAGSAPMSSVAGPGDCTKPGSPVSTEAIGQPSASGVATNR
jgi:hypothetical protein